MVIYAFFHDSKGNYVGELLQCSSFVVLQEEEKGPSLGKGILLLWESCTFGEEKTRYFII